MQSFTHFDKTGNAIMVDVSDKEENHRTAVATGKITTTHEVITSIKKGKNKKGDVLGVAQIAGIMGAKQTASLIPLCHPLSLQKCEVQFTMQEEEAVIEAIATVKTKGQTGVEMEALTAVSIALLTIYDMCKAVDKRMRISDIQLAKKTGGKSGNFSREEIEHERPVSSND